MTSNHYSVCLRVLWFSLFIIATGCSVAPAKQAAGGNERIAYAVEGRAAPVVVLQSGLGDGKSIWRQLVPRIAAHATVFSYDRPGYGASRASDAQRDPCTIAREQHDLLAQAGMRPPYVLVGHSLGGLYQFAYAKLYPDEVTGLVLLDATHPRHWRRVQHEAPALANMVKSLRALSFTRTMRREFDAQTSCLDALDLAQPLALPVRLLTRSEFAGLEQGKFKQVVEELNADWQRLTGARAERVARSGHYLQRQRPDVVARAVIELIPGR